MNLPVLEYRDIYSWQWDTVTGYPLQRKNNRKEYSELEVPQLLEELIACCSLFLCKFARDPRQFAEQNSRYDTCMSLKTNEKMIRISEPKDQQRRHHKAKAHGPESLGSCLKI